VLQGTVRQVEKTKWFELVTFLNHMLLHLFSFVLLDPSVIRAVPVLCINYK